MAGAKKPAMPTARATKRGTAVKMPMKPGNIATGSKKTALPKPAGKATKKPTLNDYLKQGKRPPVKPGLKLPSDADVRIKGYNK